MSASARTRFEVISGPADGLGFSLMGGRLEVETIAAEEIRNVAESIVRRDFSSVRLERDGQGVALSCAMPFILNGLQVHDSSAIGAGDIVQAGSTEAMVLELSRPDDTAASSGTAPEAVDEGERGARSRPAPRRCLRPGCGALNPPDAKWCQTCGWDLEDPESA